MFVQDVLTLKQPNIVVIAPDQSLSDAARLLTKHHPGILVVSDDSQRVIGIISERDLILSVANIGPAAMPKVFDIMVRDMPVCHPTDQLEAVWNRMTEHGRLYLPVIADGKVVGVISLGDILFHLFDRAQVSKERLREYFLGLSYH